MTNNSYQACIRLPSAIDNRQSAIDNLNHVRGGLPSEMMANVEDEFPPGTPVRVIQLTERRGRPIETHVVGVIEDWEELPTGSWYAYGKDDKLWLKRLRLRKLDGEETLIVLDDTTSIARIEPATA